MPVIEHVLSVKDMGSDVIKAFKDEVSGAVGETNELTRTLGLMGGAAIGVGTAYFAMTKEIADFKNEIVDAGTATGLQVSTLQGLDLAARGSGQSLGTLTGALRPFSKRLLDASKGTGEALAGFKALSIESTKLDGSLRSTDEVLKEATAKLAAIEDPTTKAALATQLFGEAGTSLIVALGDAPLEDFISRAELIGPTFMDGAAGAAELQRGIADVGLAALGAADEVTQAFGGESGILGAINATTEALVFAGAFLHTFYADAAEDMRALFADYIEGFRQLVDFASGFQPGLSKISRVFTDQGLSASEGDALMMEGFEDIFRALKNEGQAIQAGESDLVGGLKSVGSGVVGGYSTVTDFDRVLDAYNAGLEKRDALRGLNSVGGGGPFDPSGIGGAGAGGGAVSAKQQRDQQKAIEAVIAAEFARRDAAQASEADRILGQAATLRAQAATTAGAQASLSSALAFSDPFSSAVAGFRGADAFQADLNAQFGAGLAGVDASGDIAGAANLQRFNAATALGASVMANFAGVAGKAGAALGSLLAGDALGGFQSVLGGAGAAGAGAVRTGAQAAGAVAAVAGGPYGAIIGAGIQAAGDKIAVKLEGVFGQVSQALGLTTQIGRLGVGGVEQNLKTFERDFFAGLEALPIIMGEVLPRFADSFADQFAEHFPSFAQSMTREFVEHAPEIGLSLAMGFMEGMVQATGALAEDALSGQFRESFGSGPRGRTTFRDRFAMSQMQRGGDGEGFLGGLGDRVGDMAREGRFGGQRRSVIRVEGPGAGYMRDFVRQLNAQLGNQGVLLSIGGQ